MRLIKTKLQNGLVMWYDARDNFVGGRIALRKYEEYESLLIQRQINKNCVAVDIGANIGYYTLLLAKVCKKVYAIEPEKETFEILQKNINENKLTNVVLINAAISDENGQIKLYKSILNNGDHKLWTGRNIKNVENVFCRKLDDLLHSEECIDLIKIDTQGWEPKVIMGAKKIIKKYKPILFLEYSPQSYQENSLDGKGMINFLKQIYKNIWSIDYWFYYYKKGIIVDSRTGYADLLMGIKHNIFEQYRDLQWKKVIKKIFKVK